MMISKVMFISLNAGKIIFISRSVHSSMQSLKTSEGSHVIITID
jgi:hypothetical protein